MARVLRRARLALILAAACGGDRAAEPAPESPAEAESGAGVQVADRRAGDAALDEASARFLIAARFRAAGLRVVEDVSVRAGDAAITLDGFDPARRVGYEYIAAEERTHRPPEIAEARILVLESAGAAEIERAVDRFLAGLASLAEDDRPER
jgi:hypothetical protein